MTFFDLKRKYKILDKAETLYYNLKHGVSNFWHFGKVIWRFRSWDYFYLLDVIEALTSRMAYEYESDAIQYSRSRRTARELKKVAFLCRRLSADEYIENAGYDPNLPDHKRRRIFDHADYMAKQDIEYLGRTLRSIRSWWE